MALVTITGRLIQGDLYAPNDTDESGQPRLIKTGPNAGKVKSSYYIGVAIPKTAGQWWAEPFGAQMLAEVQAAWPKGEFSSRADFAYKILDGDQPTVQGRRIANAEGCWFIRLESMVQPALWNRDASARLTEPNAIKRGYWIQVCFEYKGNGQAQKPGMYANPVHVALAGYDAEIISGPDVSVAGFGKAALPAHVSATPIGGANLSAMPAPAPAPVPAAMPQLGAPAAAVPQLGAPAPVPAPAAGFAMPALPGVSAAVPAFGGVATSAPAPVATITPNPAILQPPAPPAPPAPAAEASYLVNGAVYTESALRASGYQDAHFATLQRV